MTTTVTHTIRSSGGDYSLLSAWEAAQQRDLVAADEIAVAECYDDWPSGLDDYVAVSGWTTDSTHYAKMTVADGHHHVGIPRTGFFISVDTGSSVAAPVRLGDQYNRVEWFDVLNTRSTTYRGGYDLTANHTVASRCIGEAVDGTIFEGAGQYGGYSNWPLAYACLAVGNGTADGGYGRNANSNYKAIRAYHSVAVGCVTGFESGNNYTAVYRNCVAYSNTTDFQGGQDTTSSDYNASSDLSANVFANYAIGIVAGDFADAANDDYHLSGTSSALYHAGTPIAGFTDDIDGDAFDVTAPSIGFDEYISGGTPVSNASMAAIEARGGLFSAAAVPIEHRAPADNTATAAQEALASRDQSLAALIEVLGGIDAATAAALEALLSLSNSAAVSQESLRLLGRAGAVPFAVLRGLVRGAAGGYEVGASLVVSGVAILEALRGLQGDGAAALESLGAVNDVVTVPVEIVGTRQASGAVVYEALAPASRQLAVSVEALAILQAAAASPIEAAGLEFYPTYEDLQMALSDEFDLQMALSDEFDLQMALSDEVDIGRGH